MQAYFEKPCNKLKNVNSTFRILKSKLKNLKQIFISEFRFYISV